MSSEAREWYFQRDASALQEFVEVALADKVPVINDSAVAL